MENILSVRDLSVFFSLGNQRKEIVRNINFDIETNTVLGLVGESGSGKSVTARSILRLNDEKLLVDYTGDIHFNNKNVLAMNKKQLINYRRHDVSMIFQDPMSSLNPLLKIGFQMIESFQVSDKSISKKAAKSKSIELLDQVGLINPEELMNQYPYELSGGMQQRVMIAVALAKKPRLLIADEPTTALDATVQARIIDLLKSIKTQTQMSILFITHDLTLAQLICDKIAVMNQGEIVEYAPTQELFENPINPYTIKLFSSIPGLTDQQLSSMEKKRETARIIYEQNKELAESFEISPDHHVLLNG